MTVMEAKAEITMDRILVITMVDTMEIPIDTMMVIVINVKNSS